MGGPGGGFGIGFEVEAFENECHEKYPPDAGVEHEGFTDDRGRLVRRWTSNGHRIEAIIVLVPAIAVESLRVIDADVPASS
jgi:hypothetical protein